MVKRGLSVGCKILLPENHEPIHNSIGERPNHQRREGQPRAGDGVPKSYRARSTAVCQDEIVVGQVKDNAHAPAKDYMVWPLLSSDCMRQKLGSLMA